jgi:hypothetical protein
MNASVFFIIFLGMLAIGICLVILEMIIGADTLNPICYVVAGFFIIIGFVIKVGGFLKKDK